MVPDSNMMDWNARSHGVTNTHPNEQIIRAATNESQKTRNKKQNGLAHSRFIVCVTPKQKKHCLIRESSFQRNVCETANQN